MSLRTESRKRPVSGGLHRRDADLAVALHAVAVADREQRALIEHRKNRPWCRRTSSLLSMLPPMARGMTEVMRPQFGGGATPITPKNGLSLSLPPHGSVTVPACLSIGRIFMTKSGKSSGMVPSSGMMRLKPQFCRSVTSKMSTSRTSPGLAPSTCTGPVSKCGPGPRSAASRIGRCSGRISKTGSVGRR